MGQTKPDILAVQTVASTQIFAIEQVHLRFNNGQERYFERLRGHGQEAVMIIPMLDQDTVLLVREYGVGLEDYFLGLPKGTANVGEDILTAANRELMEEIGYGARKLQVIKQLSSSPAYNTRTMSLVLATELFVQELPGDEPEKIEVIPWKLNDLSQLCQRDDFHEARSIAALYLVRELMAAG